MKETEKKRILVVEDEEHIAEGLKLNLSMEGYNVDVALNGLDGIKKWKEVRPDLIVLDIMLPGIDGLSVLQNIRLEDERVPILILSAKSSTDDRIKGLAHGVDDYLAKPFNLEEFLLRVKRLLTKTSWYQNNDSMESTGVSPSITAYTFGDNHIDFNNGTAECRKGSINLTEQELKLLKLFIVNKGKPLSRNKLLEIGWGYTRGTSTRTVDNFIVRLRKYFETDPKKPEYFISRRSVGYVFDHE